MRPGFTGKDGIVHAPHFSAGDVARIKRLSGVQVYPVPDELPDGTHVQVREFDFGFFFVEKGGYRFRIFAGCLVER